MSGRDIHLVDRRANLCPDCNTTEPLQWRHNDPDGVSNHQHHGCLLNRLFRRRSKKTSKLRVTGLCVGKSPGPVNSPHKGPVTRKMFPFDDVIMRSGALSTGACTYSADPLQWRHNECDGVSNYQRLECLLNCLFRRRSKKTSKLSATGLCAGNSPLNSPHKGPVTRKMFPFDYVIMPGL